MSEIILNHHLSNFFHFHLVIVENHLFNDVKGTVSAHVLAHMKPIKVKQNRSEVWCIFQVSYSPWYLLESLYSPSIFLAAIIRPPSQAEVIVSQSTSQRYFFQ